MKEVKKYKVEFSIETEDGMKIEVSKEMPFDVAMKMMHEIKGSMGGDSAMGAGIKGKKKGMKDG